MFKIKNTSTSSGTHHFKVQLRARYSHIRSQKKLKEVLLNSINAHDHQPVYWAWKRLYDQGDLLAIMRDFGMITASWMLD